MLDVLTLYGLLDVLTLYGLMEIDTTTSISKLDNHSTFVNLLISPLYGHTGWWSDEQKFKLFFIIIFITGNVLCLYLYTYTIFFRIGPLYLLIRVDNFLLVQQCTMYTLTSVLYYLFAWWVYFHGMKRHIQRDNINVSDLKIRITICFVSAQNVEHGNFNSIFI